MSVLEDGWACICMCMVPLYKLSGVSGIYICTLICFGEVCPWILLPQKRRGPVRRSAVESGIVMVFTTLIVYRMYSYYVPYRADRPSEPDCESPPTLFLEAQLLHGA